jgi:hypothetical protein
VTADSEPTIIGKLNTGPGLSSLTVVNDYAFVGNTSINGQLQIIDISSPAAPVLKKTFKLPGSYTDNTTIANTLTYDSGKVYLGTQKSQITELHIIDVSEVATPLELGSYEINAGINSLLVRDGLVYVASPATEEIKIIDASDPSSLYQLGNFDAPGGSGNGKSLNAIDNTLALGRTVGGQELYQLNLVDPLRPSLLSARDLNTSINALAASPTWLFLGTTDAVKTLQIWNTNPSQFSLNKYLHLPDKATALACGLNRLYPTSSSFLYIISP